MNMRGFKIIMRRNYRNNRSNNRMDNENQTIENMENGTVADMNIPSNIEDKPKIEQDKENTVNTAEANLDDYSENITMHNVENNSLHEIIDINVPENTSETITETIPETIMETTPEEISETITETTPEATPETIMETTSEAIPETIMETASEKIPETIMEITSEAIPETLSETMPEIRAEEDLELTRKEIKEQKEDSLEIQNQEGYLADCDRDVIIIDKERYEILANEQTYVFHPEYFGISPIWTNDSNFRYKCLFELTDHQLYLKSFQVTSDRGYPIINNVKPEVCNLENGFETVLYININEPLNYSGAIMFANSLVKDYRLPYRMDLYNPPCFSYKFVGELIFEEGKLITSVNHNKAMRRIRKNIDLGLRSLDKKQDIKCIKKFIKDSFIGDYQYQEKKQKRNWKEASKSKNTKSKDVHIMESGKRRYLDRIKQHIRKSGSK